MTDEQRAAMTELLARVEAGDLCMVPDGELAYRAVDDDERAWSLLFSAYTGDLNDALALLAWLLPGAWMRVSGPFRGKWDAKVFATTGNLAFDDFAIADTPTSPARALLIATLKAKLTTMGETE